MRLSEGSYSNLNVKDNIYLRGKPLLEHGNISNDFLSNLNTEDVASLVHTECSKVCETHKPIFKEMINNALVENNNKQDAELKKNIQETKKELTILKGLFNEMKNEMSELKKFSAFRT